MGCKLVFDSLRSYSNHYENQTIYILFLNLEDQCPSIAQNHGLFNVWLLIIALSNKYLYFNGDVLVSFNEDEDVFH